jgi:hypothetical protein
MDYESLTIFKGSFYIILWISMSTCLSHDFVPELEKCKKPGYCCS